MKKIFINSNLKRFKEPPSRVLNNHIQVYIDLSFEKSHSRINLKSLCSQIRIGINEINKDAHENSLNVSICSLNKAPKTKSLLLQQGLKSWKQYNNKFVYDDVLYDDVWDTNYKENLIYLTPDSTNSLKELDPNYIYILGGLVDKPCESKLTLKHAMKHGIPTFSLPIHSNGIKINPDPNLNINTCLSVMNAVAKGMDWKNALRLCVPKRRLLGGKRTVS